ncbi:hypothetical protein [Bradyrhizobium sp. URHC0002]
MKAFDDAETHARVKGLLSWASNCFMAACGHRPGLVINLRLRRRYRGIEGRDGEDNAAAKRPTSSHFTCLSFRRKEMCCEIVPITFVRVSKSSEQEKVPSAVRAFSFVASEGPGDLHAGIPLGVHPPYAAEAFLLTPLRRHKTKDGQELTVESRII